MLSASCAREEEILTQAGGGQGQGVEIPVLRDSAATRSSCAPAEEDRINNINVLIYQDGFYLGGHSYYSTSFSGGSVHVTLPNVNARYNVYLLANMGQMQAPQKESDIGAMSYSISDYASFKTDGFPMAGVLRGFDPRSGTPGIVMTKLVGRYDLYLYRNPANTKVEYTFTSGRMKACARTVRPFGSVDGIAGNASRAQSETEILQDGDFLSAEDIAALNAGGTVSLYYLENCQGLLLPQNNLPRGKTAAAVAAATGDAARAALCSYLELTAKAVTPTITYPNVVYRAYLGADMTSDFSVRRGTAYKLKLDLSSDKITGADWFVEPGDGTVTAKLLLTENNPFDGLGFSDEIASFRLRDKEPTGGILSSHSFYLQNNLLKIYYVYCSNPEMDYDVVPDTNPGSFPFVDYTLSPISVNCKDHGEFATFNSKYWKKLTFSTVCTPDLFGVVFDGKTPFYQKRAMVNFSLESYDGVLRTHLYAGVIGTIAASFELTASKSLRMKIFGPIQYVLESSNIGTEAFATGSHYWFDNWFMDYDSPFWYLYMTRSGFDGGTFDSNTLFTNYNEIARPAVAEGSFNTVYNTMNFADNYSRANQNPRYQDRANAALTYARINTLDLKFGAPKGYIFKNPSERNIPMVFKSTANLFDGQFPGSNRPDYPWRWLGIYALNGKILEYDPAREIRTFTFEPNVIGQQYTMNLDAIYNKTKLHGTPYRDTTIPDYSPPLVYGSSSGLHDAAWWSNYPFSIEDYYPLTD